MENRSDGETSADPARPWQSYHTAYTNAKAGMDGVDKEKVQRIVYEMSKGSKYFENEECKEAFMKQKIENMRIRSSKLTQSDIIYYQMAADKRILELEATRDLSRIWLHVDMDAFYAAVETLSNPSLKNKPMAVGGMSMISTANYEARKFGVRAAMPGFIARKLCPELIFVPTDFTKYTYYSDLTRKVFHKYDPNSIAASLDEAYLDITQICKERGVSGEEIAEELRTSVYEETGLTCSAGVAPNRLLAKICSDINKPNGQFVLTNDRMAVMTFISSLPIRKIGGIGKVTEHILSDVFGIKTCEEMLQKSGLLYALFSRSSADFFICVGLGLGETDAPQVRLKKSISNERTFSATGNEALFYQKLVELAEMLSTDMKKEGLRGRTLTLKLKTSSFKVRTRAVTLQKYIWSTEDIMNHASRLLKAELPISLRLIGLRMSHLDVGKSGVPSDPAQKTLNNFIISEDASVEKVDDCNSSGLDVSDDHVMIDREAGLPIDDYHEKWYCSSKDLSVSNHMSDLGNSNCTLSDGAGETESHRPLTKETADKVVETDPSSLLGQSEGIRLEGVSKRTNLLDDGAICATVSWLNDYKCSLCGIELPPSFVEERLEHADFHLAERLQEEESCTNSRNFMPRQRALQSDRHAKESKSKKRKPSPKEGKHIPIDVFFVKSNQNF